MKYFSDLVKGAVTSIHKELMDQLQTKVNNRKLQVDELLDVHLSVELSKATYDGKPSNTWTIILTAKKGNTQEANASIRIIRNHHKSAFDGRPHSSSMEFKDLIVNEVGALFDCVTISLLSSSITSGTSEIVTPSWTGKFTIKAPNRTS